jgi:hypothetical protein
MPAARAGCPEHRVEGLRAGAELGRVGLADDDGPGGAQALDEQAVAVGHVVAVDGRAERGAQTGGERQVLHRQRQPVQRPGRVAARQRGIGARSPRERALAVERADRVQGRILRLDAGEVHLHQLDRRQLAAQQQRPLRTRGPVIQLV